MGPQFLSNSTLWLANFKMLRTAALKATKFPLDFFILSQSYKTILVFKNTKLVLNYLTVHYAIKGLVNNLTSIEVTHPQQI
jgi:hypothetical protein